MAFSRYAPMNDYLLVLILAALPALGNFAGGVAAEFVIATQRLLSRALHVAAGIVIAVVATELMPRAMGGAAPGWAIVTGLLLGGLFYVLLEWVVDRLHGGDEAAGGAWMIFAAVAIDLFSDGLMVGVGSVISFRLALILTLGQVLANFPEGLAAIANFKAKGAPRGRRLLLSAALLLPSLLGATFGYWLLRGQGDALKLAGLAFIAGLLVVAAVEEMLKEAHESAEDTRASSLFFIGGFAMFTLLTVYLDV